MSRSVHETTTVKINAASSPRGRDGLRHLVVGRSLAMRLWEDEEAGEVERMHSHDYETVGYAIRGRAELHIERQLVALEPGDSWVVPAGARHGYRILERFTAVEATHPSYRDQERDAG